MLRCVSGPSAIGQGKRRFEVGHGVKKVGGREVEKLGGWGRSGGGRLGGGSRIKR